MIEYVQAGCPLRQLIMTTPGKSNSNKMLNNYYDVMTIMMIWEKGASDFALCNKAWGWEGQSTARGELRKNPTNSGDIRNVRFPQPAIVQCGTHLPSHPQSDAE